MKITASMIASDPEVSAWVAANAVDRGDKDAEAGIIGPAHVYARRRALRQQHCVEARLALKVGDRVDGLEGRLARLQRHGQRDVRRRREARADEEGKNQSTAAAGGPRGSGYGGGGGHPAERRGGRSGVVCSERSSQRSAPRRATRELAARTAKRAERGASLLHDNTRGVVASRTAATGLVKGKARGNVCAPQDSAQVPVPSCAPAATTVPMGTAPRSSRC